MKGQMLAQKYFTIHLVLSDEGAFLRFCQCGDEEGKRLMSFLDLEVEIEEGKHLMSFLDLEVDMHLERDCQPWL